VRELEGDYRRRGWARAAARWLALGATLWLTTGCSWVLMDRLPSDKTIVRRDLKPHQLRCTESLAAPIVDVVLTAASIPLVLPAIVFAPSALTGFFTASQCRSYRSGDVEVFRKQAWKRARKRAASTKVAATPKKPLAKTSRPRPVATPGPDALVKTTPCTGRPDGRRCDDGDRCTQEGRCRAGRCVSAAVSCDDGRVCTTDRCDPRRGCVHRPLSPCCGDGRRDSGEACDDGNRLGGDGCTRTCTVEVIIRRLDTRDERGRFLSREGGAQAQAEAFCKAAFYAMWAAQVPESFGTGSGYAYPTDGSGGPPRAISGRVQRRVQCMLPPP